MQRVLIIFSSDMVMFIMAILLCTFMVRDRLKKPVWQVFLVNLLLAAAVSLAEALSSFEIGNLLMPLYLFVVYRYYCRNVDVSPNKLLFIMMLVVSLTSFLVGMNIAFRVDTTNPLLPLFNLVVAVLIAPAAFFLLRGQLWPVARDLDAREWRLLWLIPTFFSLLEVLLAFALESQPVWLHALAVVFTMAGALVTYYLMFSMLRRSVEQARETERDLAAEAYTKLQGEQYERITENIAQTRAARHDLRHQMLVLKGYLDSGRYAEAADFCGALSDAIPVVGDRIYCSNFAVNAVAAHYAHLAEENGITVELELGLPEKIPGIEDRELCIIVGNLLENAVEACCRMEDTNRTIRMDTSNHNRSLFINMTNSYNGEVDRRDGVFYSMKHSGEGVGLSSVRAVAKRHKGDAEYLAGASEFRSVVYIHVDKTEQDGDVPL